MVTKSIVLNFVKNIPVGTFRKWLLLILLLIWSLATYFYLGVVYNPSVIHMEMVHITPAPKVMGVLQGAGIRDLALGYEKPYGEGRLIMTTGGDAVMERVVMAVGHLIMPGEEKKAVIGDNMAIRDFNTVQAVGREIKVGNQWYQVVGVIDDSWDLMISYGEEQLNDGWHAMNIRYTPPEVNRQDIRIRDVERALALNDLHYHRKVHYDTLINFHLNVAVLSALIMLFLAVIRVYGYLRRQVNAVWSLWKERRNTTQGVHFISTEKVLHRFVFNLMASTMISALMGYWLLKQLRLPDEFLPDNIFSPGSWGIKLGNLWDYWNTLMENGITGIYKTTVFSWLLLTVIVLVLLLKWATKKMR